MHTHAFIRRTWQGFAIGLTVALFAGCSYTSVATQRVIEQEALVPAPAGPAATGPMVPDGGVALQGTVSLNQVQPTERTRQQGETGHLVMGTQVSGRLAYGVSDRVELGFGVDIGRGEWATPLASDLETKASVEGGSAFDDVTVVRAGPQIRLLIAGDDRFGLGLNGEVMVGTVPYVRDVFESTVVREHDSGGAVTTGGWDSESHTQDRTTVWFWRAGLFATSRPIDALSLTGGVMVQTHPYFFGSISADGVCYYPGGRCDGVGDADDVDPFTQQSLFTGYLTAGYDLGPVTLLAQIHGHIAGEKQIVDPSRYGGELGARVTF